MKIVLKRVNQAALLHLWHLKALPYLKLINKYLALLVDLKNQTADRFLYFVMNRRAVLIHLNKPAKQR